jgi:cytochrome P450
MSFGQGGPHVCLGMWLARLEVRVLFEELAKRIKSIEPAGQQKVPAVELHRRHQGSLPVRVTLQ